MRLGDARVGKFSDNLAAFGRTLRRAGVRVDPARIALAADAALTVGLDRREDLSAALEAVLISREQDRLVYRELFDAFFRDPNMAHKLLAQLLPSAEGKAEPSKRRPRVREALSPQHAFGKQAQPKPEDDKVDFEAIRTRVEANTDLAGAFTAQNSEQNIKAKFDEVLDDVLYEFVNTKLDLFNKLSEDKANAQWKRLWFKEMLGARRGGGVGMRRGA